MMSAICKPTFNFKRLTLSLIMFNDSTRIGGNMRLGFGGNIITFLTLSPPTLSLLRYHFSSMISITLSLGALMIFSYDFTILSLTLSLFFNYFNSLITPLEKRSTLSPKMFNDFNNIFNYHSSLLYRRECGGGHFHSPPTSPFGCRRRKRVKI